MRTVTAFGLSLLKALVPGKGQDFASQTGSSVIWYGIIVIIRTALLASLYIGAKVEFYETCDPRAYNGTESLTQKEQREHSSCVEDLLKRRMALIKEFLS